jgi:hypothetical protein
VELIEGHGAGGEREPGRDARMPPGSRTGLRDLHQADAGLGGLGRDPGPGPVAGPVQPAGAPVRRREEPGREEEGDHRDHAHLLKIAYQVLKSGMPYREPGADFYTRRESPLQKQAWLERQMQKLHPAAPSPSAHRRPP